MDIKFLSRKFLLTTLLTVLSTWLLVTGNIGENQFGIVILAAIGSYIVGRTIDKKYSEGKSTFPDIRDRIVSLFSREFVIALVAVIGVSYLKLKGFVGSDLWFQVISAIGGAYNVFNPLEKIEK